MPLSFVSVILAVLALLVSVGLLIINYKNQIERRHGELIQLRTQILSSLSALQQRFTSVQVHGELVRMEIRRLPDSEDKYSSIEDLPALLAGIAELKDYATEGLRQFEPMEAQKVNRSATLLRLQESAARFEKVMPKAQETEERMLKLLENIRKTIGA